MRLHRTAPYYLLGGLLLWPLFVLAQDVSPMVPPLPVPPSPAPVASPATLLPSVALPAMGSVSPEKSATNAAAEKSPPASVAANGSAAAAAPAVVAPAMNYSYGDITYSLFYTSAQIDHMKVALKNAETRLANGESAAEGVMVQEAVVQAPAEPSTYPIFYLSSIVFHGPNNWTVWLERSASAAAANAASAASAGLPPGVSAAPASGATASGEQQTIKLTPNSNPGEITVTQISADSVTFSWKPTYLKAIAARTERHLFADPDAYTHRTALNAHVDYAPGDSEIRFTLRQNQSFAVAYFMCFEGRVPNGALQPLAPPAPAEGAAPVATNGGETASAPAAGADKDEGIDALLSRASQQRAAKSATGK